eukprot:5760801-Pleurochrysis_carterae.AAC.1
MCCVTLAEGLYALVRSLLSWAVVHAHAYDVRERAHTGYACTRIWFKRRLRAAWGAGGLARAS